LQGCRLRDRDAVLTREGLIFRVYGYTHPPRAYICDVEYAPASIFKSEDPRAPRQKGKKTYYKFYLDHGLQFVRQNFPQYMVWHAPLQTRLVGVSQNQISEIRRPEEAFQKLQRAKPKDSLLLALQTVSSMILSRTRLSEADFGVFGSLLHGFYHPQYSDIDLIIYGKAKLDKLQETLKTLYHESSSYLVNEFETEEPMKEKAARWKFVNYSAKEYWWHQRRKAVYALFHDQKSGRVIKTEFEPVKEWSEIHNEYDSQTRILKQGWIKAVVHVTDDLQAPFMPSVYKVEVKKILEGKRAENIKRILSYVEEFRMQTEQDEEVYVEGNLEKVITPAETFHQITLTYGPRYYEQVLKVVKPSPQEPRSL
jgi:predicted nucleotidyltransferase